MASTIEDLAICGVMRAVTLVFGALPLRVACALGRGLGRAVYYLDFKNRRRTLAQVEQAFGDDLDGAACRRIVRDTFTHFGQVAMEVVQAPRVLRADTVRRIHVHGEELLEEIRGRATIFITGHLGNWEILGRMMDLLGYPMHSVYRRFGGPRTDRLVRLLRESARHRIVPEERALYRLMHVLRNGGHVGLVADQYARRNGVFVDFLGRSSACHPITALLALRTGAPIVAGFIVHRRGCFEYDFYLERVEWEVSGRPLHDMVALTQTYMAMLERHVRRRPAQYLWIHKRWHSKDPARSAEQRRRLAAEAAAVKEAPT